MRAIDNSQQYDYAQDTEPGGAGFGETWLDTSEDPPVGKVYADMGDGGSWVREQVSETVFDNLDAKVSEAGGGGVDWASKTPKTTQKTGVFIDTESEELLSITGSGYILNAQWKIEFPDTAENNEAILYIDDTEIFTETFEEMDSNDGNARLDGSRLEYSGIYRFSESVKMEVVDGGDDNNYAATLDYVLD